MARVRDWVMPSMGLDSGCYWTIDDTGFPKKGKQDNCQVAVSLSLASAQASIPIAYQLHLPKDWAADPVRRKAGGVPETQAFATKPEIALAQMRQAVAAGVPMGVVLADAVYGDETAFCGGITELGMLYAVGIRPATTVWAPGTAPLPPKAWADRGRRPTKLRREPGNAPAAVKALACGLPGQAWRTVTWREGGNNELSGRFTALRVRPAHRDCLGTEMRAEEWLLIEGPDGEAGPAKYFLTTAPEDATLEQMVFVTKMRWRTERDCHDLKQEFGLGHYEGRGWRGFHHPATLSIAAYGLLMTQRLKAGSDGGGKKTSRNAKCLMFPKIASLGEVQRAQRQVADSITTLRLRLRLRLSVALASALGHCPHCNRISSRLNL